MELQEALALASRTLRDLHAANPSSDYDTLANAVVTASVIAAQQESGSDPAAIVVDDHLADVLIERDRMLTLVSDIYRVAFDEYRTYTWNGQTHIIQSPLISDLDVAGEVRMLMRNQLDHESVCTLARDRIVHLHERLGAIKTILIDAAPALHMASATLSGST